MIRRVGRPGLVGLAARTAVVAGTANAMENRQMNRRAAAAEQQQAAAAYQQQQMDQAAQAAVAAQAAAAPTPAPVAAAQAAPAVDVTAQLLKLADLHNAGALSDEEFAAAKAKLLG
ncbi:MAG: SHOCT domain-containing protein [Microbacterium sp.]|jgi:hypothetical protein|nr:SHOCT domain-containing protein [Microbacterium sp.]